MGIVLFRCFTIARHGGERCNTETEEIEQAKTKKKYTDKNKVTRNE